MQCGNCCLGGASSSPLSPVPEHEAGGRAGISPCHEEGTVLPGALKQFCLPGRGGKLPLTSTALLGRTHSPKPLKLLWFETKAHLCRNPVLDWTETSSQSPRTPIRELSPKGMSPSMLSRYKGVQSRASPRGFVLLWEHQFGATSLGLFH